MIAGLPGYCTFVIVHRFRLAELKSTVFNVPGSPVEVNTIPGKILQRGKWLHI